MAIIQDYQELTLTGSQLDTGGEGVSGRLEGKYTAGCCFVQVFGDDTPDPTQIRPAGGTYVVEASEDGFSWGELPNGGVEGGTDNPVKDITNEADPRPFWNNCVVNFIRVRVISGIVASNPRPGSLVLHIRRW